MSPRLFVGNLNFEHQLANRTAGKVAERVAAEFASAWLGVLKEGDVLWMPEFPEADFSTEMETAGFPSFRLVSRVQDIEEIISECPLECCAWGWSEEIVNWANEQGLSTSAPPLDAVRIANSRRFSFDLEHELKIGLPWASRISTIEEWQATIAHFTSEQKWVIKSEFSMAARERLLGRGNQLSQSQLAWVQQQWRAGLELFFEPWVPSLAEAGLQFEIPPTGKGDPYHLGTTTLLTDSSGQYRGSRFDSLGATENDWSKAVEIGRIVCERLQSLGYFGPIGVDAMWYRDTNGSPKLRPLQDVNARWTMGRLALEFRGQLKPHEAGAWLHLRCPAKDFESAKLWWKSQRKVLPTEVCLLRTSPITVGQQVCLHGTALLIAEDEQQLQSSIQYLL